MALTGHADQARKALERVAECERDAIKMHESAAEHLEQMAAQLERHALRDADPRLREEALETAANARRRARSALARATQARERLREQGFDPDE